jgi:anti-sigma factor RsiW
MNPMQCREAHEALTALLDGELSADQEPTARAHIAGCPACAERMRDYQRLGEALRADAYVAAPLGLEEKLRTRLAMAAPPANDIGGWPWRRLGQQAAALVLVSGLSGLLGWHLTQSASELRRLERDVISAHARSLLQDNTVQVASSHSHTVKPWFNGRIEFAPTVKDLTADGFPLQGGRLDIIDTQRVAALVYKRRLHVINVFIWPAAARPSAAPTASTVQGYNTLAWTAGGLTYWAVSDLNAKELAELQRLL